MSKPIPAPFTVLRGHSDAVLSLKFINSSLLCSGSGDGVVKFWDLPSLRCIHSSSLHEKSILSICNTATNNKIITVGRDRTLKLWDINTLKNGKCPPMDPILTITCGSDHFCNSVTYLSKQGPDLVASPGFEQHQIFVWDLRTPLRPVQILSAPPSTAGMVTAICFAPPTSTSPSTSTGTAINTTSTSSTSTTSTATAGNAITEGAVGAVGTTAVPLLLAGYEDGSIYTFDHRREGPLYSQKCHKEPVFALAVSPKVRWNKVTGREERTFMSGAGDALLQQSALFVTSSEHIHSNCEASVECTATSASENIVGLGRDDSVQSHRTVTNTRIHSDSCENHRGAMSKSAAVALKQAGTSCIKYRSDGRLIASSHWDNTVRLFDHKKLKPLAILRHHRESVYALDFADSYNYADHCSDDHSKDGHSHIKEENTKQEQEEEEEGSSASNRKYAHRHEDSCVDNANENNASTGTAAAAVEAAAAIGSGVFATGSKDHTIALWDLYSHTYKL